MSPPLACPWVVLRHELPDGSWHFDWMIARDGPSGNAPLITFRAAHRPDLPGVAAFDAQRLRDHRREYLSFEGEVSGGRGRVTRVARGTCRVVEGDSRLGVELVEARERWIASRATDGSDWYRFERAARE